MNLNINIDNVNYIKIIYKDNDEFTHCIKASLKRMDERGIFACAKFDEGLYIKTPQDVKISIACENGLYQASTVLKYIEKEEPYIFFTLKYPETVDYQQKREFFRVKINENATIEYTTFDDKLIEIPCKTFDLSANGVRLAISEKLNLPNIVRIKLYLPKKIVTTNAKFIRTDEEDKILKASFTFIDLQESDLDYISQICFQKQLESRRKALI